MLKRFLILTILICGSALGAQAANHYVRSGAGGSGAGTSWANACTGFTGSCAPGSLVRGDTYFVASGTYAGQTFNTADSGTTEITIVGATVANNSGDAGWSNSYSVSSADGGSPAVWTSAVNWTTDYWTWDGLVGNVWDETTGDYGFAYSSGQSRGTTIGTVGSSGACGSATNHIWMAHFYAKATSSDVEKEFEEGNTYGGAIGNITFSNFFLDGWQGILMTKSGACSGTASAGFVVQYGITINNSSTPANHGEVIDPNERPLSGLIFRYTIVRGNSGSGGETGIIVANNSDNDNAQIYGNVFDDNLVGNGIITGTSAGDLNNALIYNNTFLNMPGASGNALCGTGEGSGNIAQNNMFYNMSAQVGSGCTNDYNAYFSTTNTPTETHRQTGSGNPFVSSATFNYELTAETTNGNTLSSLYNTDAFGVGRPGADGVWSRGALQFQTSGPGISFSPTSLGFGSIIVGSTSTTDTVTVTNTGSSNLTIGAVTITGANAADFSIVSGGTCTASASTTVTASSTCTILTNFTPSITGAESASISVTDNASGSPHTVPMTGTGATVIPPPSAHRPVLEGSLPSGMVGASYSSGLTATGDSPPDKWSVNPTVPGMALNASTGALTGTPTTAGTYSLQFQVTDSYNLAGCSGETPCTNSSAVYPVTLTINPALLPSGLPQISNRVSVLRSVANIRATATYNGFGTQIGTEAQNALGTVVAGPVAANPTNTFYWVEVTWDKCSWAKPAALPACTGWVGTDNLKIVTTSPPPPVPTMATSCAWLSDGVTWQCTTVTANMPSGTAIKSVVTSGTLTNTLSGTHP